MLSPRYLFGYHQAPFRFEWRTHSFIPRVYSPSPLLVASSFPGRSLPILPAFMTGRKISLSPGMNVLGGPTRFNDVSSFFAQGAEIALLLSRSEILQSSRKVKTGFAIATGVLISLNRFLFVTGALIYSIKDSLVLPFGALL